MQTRTRWRLCHAGPGNLRVRPPVSSSAYSVRHLGKFTPIHRYKNLAGKTLSRVALSIAGHPVLDGIRVPRWCPSCEKGNPYVFNKIKSWNRQPGPGPLRTHTHRRQRTPCRRRHQQLARHRQVQAPGIGADGRVGYCSLQKILISDISCGCDLVKAKGRFFRFLWKRMSSNTITHRPAMRLLWHPASTLVREQIDVVKKG